jgi:maltooligosyltrehalose trehalohydrolase
MHILRAGMTAAFAPGAVPDDVGSTRFTVWAPARRTVTLSLAGIDRMVDLPELGGGYFGALVPDCGVGTRYAYLLDGEGPYADPASRSQPDGVHGPSEVIDLSDHHWEDAAHRTRPLWQHVISEVHVGTLTPEGTFDGAIAALDDLVEVGISAVELMPVAQFPGKRNWGYDGVFPFAVQNSYGGAAGLQRFVDACHQRGLDVILDVVYNHLGPEGNVLDAFGPYFTDRYRTPWGPAVNFDGPSSNDVRAFFLHNARQWFTDFHIDGLRLDAVHEIIDRTAIPFLVELSEEVGNLGDGFLVAESADNNPRIVTPVSSGGFGMDAQWNDDFHHAVHAAITGECTGYYGDYGTVEDIAIAMHEGFVYQGEYSAFRGRDHGARSGDLPPERFVVFAQNHDHIGNRPKGDRLVNLVTLEQVQLATALVLLAPGVPLLFMGEEYGDPAPFPYFIDHGDPVLVEAVRAGRAQEFAAFAELGEVPDPDAEATFDAARLDRALRHKGDHQRQWALHRALIALRRSSPALQRSRRTSARASVASRVVTLIRSHPRESVVALFNVSAEPAQAALPPAPRGGPAPEATRCWSKLIDAGAPAFGGRGEALPHVLAPGDTVSLRPWKFCAFRVTSGEGGG